MKKLKTRAIQTRDNIVKHRGKIGFSLGLALGVTAGAVVIVKQAEAWNDWLEFNNLTEFYYGTNEALTSMVKEEIAAGAFS